MHTNREPATPGLYPTRRAIADEIERLLALLDELDGDENLEPYLAGWRLGPDPDLEDDSEEDEPIGDEEPSLGWTHTDNQAARRWHGHPRDGYGALDGEAEHDGREPDADDEDGHDEEGPMRVAPLKARRDAGKEVRP